MEKEKFLKRSVVENDIMCQTTNGEETVSEPSHSQIEKVNTSLLKDIRKTENLPYNGYLVDFYKSKTDEGKIKVVFMKTVRHCIHDYIVNMYSFIQYFMSACHT